MMAVMEKYPREFRLTARSSAAVSCLIAAAVLIYRLSKKPDPADLYVHQKAKAVEGQEKDTKN